MSPGAMEPCLVSMARLASPLALPVCRPGHYVSVNAPTTHKQDISLWNNGIRAIMQHPLSHHRHHHLFSTPHHPISTQWHSSCGARLVSHTNSLARCPSLNNPRGEEMFRHDMDASGAFAPIGILSCCDEVIGEGGPQRVIGSALFVRLLTCIHDDVNKH